MKLNIQLQLTCVFCTYKQTKDIVLIVRFVKIYKIKTFSTSTYVDVRKLLRNIGALINSLFKQTSFRRLFRQLIIN